MTCTACGEPAGPGDRFCEACGTRRHDPGDHVEIALPRLAGVTDRGRRHLHNEDALALRVLPGVRLAVLCDGVSSVPRPDIASAAAARAVLTTLVAELGRSTPDNPAADDDVDTAALDPAAAMRAAAAAGAAAVVATRVSAQLPGPSACTLVAAAVVGETATIGWLGDSRAYWLPADGRPGRVLTVDDSWLEQTLATGTTSVAAAVRDPRVHAITAWLGAGAAAEDVHVVTVAPDGPGTVLLCTDGLWNTHPTPHQLAAAITTDPATDPLGAARDLVASALHRGGHDNVTVAVLPLTAPATDAPEDPP